eukprot:1153540-Pelagomonas_calceolata.AAC.2
MFNVKKDHEGGLKSANLGTVPRICSFVHVLYFLPFYCINPGEPPPGEPLGGMTLHRVAQHLSCRDSFSQDCAGRQVRKQRV